MPFSRAQGRAVLRHDARLRDVVVLVAIDLLRHAVFAVIEIVRFGRGEMAAVRREIGAARLVDRGFTIFQIACAARRDLAALQSLCYTSLLIGFAVAHFSGHGGERYGCGENGCERSKVNAVHV